MNDENKAPSNDPEKSSTETNSSSDIASDKNPEAGSSNTKDTDNTAVEPHSQAESVASVEAIDGIIQSIFGIAISFFCENSCICFCIIVLFCPASCVVCS